MVQVTIIWQGSEIGYGEGESREYAMTEAMNSVELMYQECIDEWKFEVQESK